MKRIILIILFLFIGNMAFAQSRANKLKEVRDKWELTTDGRVAFRTIYQFPTKSQERLSQLTEQFFQRYFVDNPLEEVDWERGYFRARAGFSRVHSTYRVYDGDNTVSTIYDFVVEIKEDRVRVSIILQAYEGATIPEEGGFIRNSTLDPAAFYPVNPNGKNKDYFMNVFYGTYQRAERVTDSYREYIYEQPDVQPAADDW